LSAGTVLAQVNVAVLDVPLADPSMAPMWVEGMARANHCVGRAMAATGGGAWFAPPLSAEE
jgi:hypothetical protein